MANLDDYCTVYEAAAIADCHPETIKRMIREGRLPAQRIGLSWAVLRTDAQAIEPSYTSNSGQPRLTLPGEPTPVIRSERPTSEVWSATKLAQFARCANVTVITAIHRGELAADPPNRTRLHWAIPVAEATRWLEARQQQLRRKMR